MSTLAQLRSIVRAGISQEDTSNTDLSDSQLNGFINVATRELGALVRKPIDHDDVQVEQGVNAYPVPSDFVLLMTAYFGDPSTGDQRAIRIIPEEELKEVMPNWLSSAVEDQGRPQFVTLIDRRTLLLSPTPSAEESAAGKLLSFGYVYQPAVMVTDSESPDLPIVYHDLVARFAESLAWSSKLNKPDLAASILTEVYARAKKMEALIIKDSANSNGFYWGNSIDTEDDGFSGLRFPS